MAQCIDHDLPLKLDMKIFAQIAWSHDRVLFWHNAFYLTYDEIGLHKFHVRSEGWGVRKSIGSYAIDRTDPVSLHGPTRTRSRRPPGSSRSGRTVCRAWRASRSSVRTASWAVAGRSSRRCRGWHQRSAASRSRPTAAAHIVQIYGPGHLSCFDLGTRPDPEADPLAHPRRVPPNRLGHIQATPEWAAMRRLHRPATTRPRDASRRSVARRDTATNERNKMHGDATQSFFPPWRIKIQIKIRLNYMLNHIAI